MTALQHPGTIQFCNYTQQPVVNKLQLVSLLWWSRCRALEHVGEGIQVPSSGANPTPSFMCPLMCFVLPALSPCVMAGTADSAAGTADSAALGIVSARPQHNNPQACHCAAVTVPTTYPDDDTDLETCSA